jgi:hypothetical protein
MMTAQNDNHLHKLSALEVKRLCEMTMAAKRHESIAIGFMAREEWASAHFYFRKAERLYSECFTMTSVLMGESNIWAKWLAHVQAHMADLKDRFQRWDA